MRKALGYSYFLVILALFFYTFTQVDLSLTLSRASVFQSIEKSFQWIGYFQRPISTDIFVVLLVFMFGFYLYFLNRAKHSRIALKEISILIGGTALILALSYNAFSYDLFNYIFDAKIITFYHLNPYVHKALDFPGDPMLTFMQWTHRTYPYGPIWLAITAPLSYMGQNIFIPTFFLFKFLAAAFYLGSCYLVYKISGKIIPEYKLFPLVLFALNPLVIVETLISAHNDIAMIFFALLGVYLYASGKKVLALLLIIFSSQIKIPTIALLAPVLIGFIPQHRINYDNRRFILTCISSMILALFYVLTKLELQPWYFLWILPFLCLLRPNKYLTSLIIGLSLGLLFRYLPYLYNGNWNGNAAMIKSCVTLIIPLIFISLTFIFDKVGLWKKS